MDKCILLYTDHQARTMERKIAKGDFSSLLIKSSAVHKTVTFILAVNNIPFHRVNYGAGVVKILKNEGGICAHCGGNGCITEKEG